METKPSSDISRRLFASLVILLLFAATGVASAGTSKERVRLAFLISRNSGQQRAFMVEDPNLSSVAQSRAEDMAARGYFSHTNPDGKGPNSLIRSSGYVLPSSYDQSAAGNNVESIAAGQTSPTDAFNAWLGSQSHRPHVLAEDSFYRDQTSFGVGYAYAPGSPYTHYWVFLSAPPNASSGAIGKGTALVGPFGGATNLGGGWYSNGALGRFQLSGDGRSAWIESLDETVSYDGHSAYLNSEFYGTLTPRGGESFYSSAAGEIEAFDRGGWVLQSRVGAIIAVGGGWFWSDGLQTFLFTGDSRFF